MRIISFLHVPALFALLAQAAPIPDDIDVRALRPLPKLPPLAPPRVPAPAPPSPSPPPPPPPVNSVPPPVQVNTTPNPPPVASVTAIVSASSSPAALSVPPPSASIAPPSASIAPPSASVTPPSASLSPSLASIAATSVASASSSVAPISAASPVSASSSVTSSAIASSTSTAAVAQNTTSVDGTAGNSTDVFCPIYSDADLADLEARHVALEKRAKGEEYWFRWEDPALASSGDILQLRLPHEKNFDDQAYKWISTNAAKVTRGKIQSGRVGTVFVLPAGTRAAVLGAAQKFEDTSAAQQRADFVVKDNEPGDVGIQGITASADGTLPLDVFRNKVLRTVVKKVNKGKATFVTITKGKRSNTATKDDQLALQVACG